MLDLTDRHTDLAGQFAPSGTTLTGSRSFGPWGAVTASGGSLAGSLGYQSQYTSPATGQVNMGARWYNPATGSFGNKDTVTNKPVPDSASASPFGYAADNPLNATDPTGHMAYLDVGGTRVPNIPKAIAAAKKAYQAQVKAAAAKKKPAKPAAKKQPVKKPPATSAGCLLIFQICPAANPNPRDSNGSATAPGWILGNPGGGKLDAVPHHDLPPARKWHIRWVLEGPARCRGAAPWRHASATDRLGAARSSPCGAAAIAAAIADAETAAGKLFKEKSNACFSSGQGAPQYGGLQTSAGGQEIDPGRAVSASACITKITIGSSKYKPTFPNGTGLGGIARTSWQVSSAEAGSGKTSWSSTRKRISKAAE